MQEQKEKESEAKKRAQAAGGAQAWQQQVAENAKSSKDNCIKPQVRLY